MMKKRNVSWLTGLLIGLGMTSLSFAELPPIKIGVIGPVTGTASEDMGQSIIGGARVFLADVNQIGGILGRRVELVERDDQAKPEVGVAMAKELIEKEKVVAVVGYSNTGVALQAAKVFQEAKIPLIVTGATGVAVTKSTMPPAYPASYVFRTATTDGLQPIVILNDLIDRHKIEKIALLHDESPFGQLAKQNVLAELQRRNLKPVQVESFKVGDPDVTTQLQQIKESGAQAMILYCLAGDGAMVVKNAARLQMKLPIVGPWTLSQQSFIDKAGASAEGVRTSVTFIENDLSPVSNAFSLSYRKINKVSRIPSPVAAAQTYDALRLLALAMYQANSDESTKVQGALENLQQHTITTVVTRYFKPFSSTDHDAITSNMVYLGEIHNGKVVYAYKEDADRGLIARTKKTQ